VGVGIARLVSVIVGAWFLLRRRKMKQQDISEPPSSTTHELATEQEKSQNLVEPMSV